MSTVFRARPAAAQALPRFAAPARPGVGSLAGSSRNSEAAAVERTCRHCGIASAKGKVGPPDSEYAGKWYCDACWRAWDIQQNPNHAALPKCARPSCTYQRHATQAHGFCCWACTAGREHDVACDRWPFDPSHADRGASAAAADALALEALSVLELRRLGKANGVDLANCVEKADLVRRLCAAGVRAAGAPQRGPRPPPPPAETASNLQESQVGVPTGPLEAMSLAELRRECIRLGVDTAGCVEKADLVGRLRAVQQPGHGGAGGGRVAALRRAAVACDDAAAFAALLGEGGGSDGREEIDALDGSGRTLLHLVAASASRPGAAAAASLLLRRGARAELPDSLGQVPLSAAVAAAAAAPDARGAGCGLETVRALLSAAGLPPRCVEEWSFDGCPLARAVAASEGGRALARALLEAGARLPWYSSVAARRAGGVEATTGVAGGEQPAAAAAAAAAPPAAPRGPCARPTCRFLSHSTREFAGYCCGRCQDGDLVQPHGPACERARAPVEEGQAPADLQGLPLRELRALAAARGLDMAGCVERGDLLRVLRAAGASAAPAGKFALEEDPDGGRSAPLIIPIDEEAGEAAEVCSDDAEEIDMEAAWQAARDRPPAPAPPPPPEAAAAPAAPDPPPPAPQPAAAPSPPRRPASLRAAVKAGDLEAVRSALGRLGSGVAAALEGADASGWTPLHICAAGAAGAGCAEIAALLVHSSACVDAPDTEGRTPLDLAVAAALEAPALRRQGALAVARALLSGGASPGLRWQDEDGPLARAAVDESGQAVAELLLEFGADLAWHGESLRGAVLAGRVDGVQRALRRLGVDAACARVRLPDASGRTLLHRCLESGGPGAAGVARLLLAEAADVEALDAHGRSPLEVAVAAALRLGSAGDGAEDAVKALLDAGARANQAAEWRLDAGPLAVAWSAGGLHDRLVQLLLHGGADLPWHPASLRSAVAACDAAAVQAAIHRLGSQAVWAACQVDERGDTLLHLCGRTASRTGASEVAQLLLESSAQPCLNARDSAGEVPLSLAVARALRQQDEEELQEEGSGPTSWAQDLVLTLLLAGADIHCVEEWRSADSPLAVAVLAGRGAALSDLLLTFGADLPWHPHSVQSAVRACDPEAVELALDRLRRRAGPVLALADAQGRTLLHLAAEQAVCPGAGYVSRLLVGYLADLEAADLAGRTPLALAVSSTIGCAEAERVWALGTVRALLAAQACCSAEEWRADRSPLAQAAVFPAGAELAKLLMESGADLPWYDWAVGLGSNCEAHGIPLDLIGPKAASTLLREYERWQGMGAKDLRAACKSRALPTHGCVERADLVARLHQARLQQAVADAREPETRLVGRWCYGCKPAEYTITRHADGCLRFEGPHTTGGTVMGTLAEQGDGWLLAALSTAEGVEVGQIRLRYCEEELCVRSNFQSVTMAAWGRDIVAHKAVDVDLADGPPAAAAPPLDLGAGDPGLAGHPIADPISPVAAPVLPGPGLQAAQAAAAKQPDEGHAGAVEDARRAALSRAVDHLDAGAVVAALALAAEAVGDVEALVGGLDAEGGTLLHRCVRAGGAGLGAEAAARVARLLLEARAGVDEPNSRGEAPLLSAARAGHEGALPLARVLLAARADPGRLDPSRRETPLMAAAARGEAALCRLLLHSRADPAQKSGEGLTARDLAAEHGHKRVANLLRAAWSGAVGEDVAARAGPLWAAAEACDPQALEAALKELGQQDAADAVLLTNGVPGGGQTLLHVCSARACTHGADAVTRLLIEQSARVDVEDIDEQRPLELAVRAAAAAVGRPDQAAVGLGTVRVLLAAGARASSADWRDPAGHLAQAAAARAGAVALCRVLVEFGAELPWFREAEEPPEEQAEGGEPDGTAAVDGDVVEAPPSDSEPLESDKEEEEEEEDEEELERRTSGLEVDVPESEQDDRSDSLELGEAPDCPGADPAGAQLPLGAGGAPPPAPGGDEEEEQQEGGEGADEEGDEGFPACCLAHGVPLDLLGAARAKAMLRDRLRWRAMGLRELRALCEAQDLPTADCLEKSDLVDRLARVRLWEVMPLEVLQEQCMELGISIAYDFATRADLEDALREHSGFPSAGSRRLRAQCKERSIPVDKLSAEDAAEILAVAQRLEASRAAELKREYERWGLPLAAGLEKQDMVRNLTTIFVWQCLPIEELRKECKAKGVAFVAAHTKEELIGRLVVAAWPTFSPGESRYKGFFDCAPKSEPRRPAPPPQAAPRPQAPRADATAQDDWEWRRPSASAGAGWEQQGVPPGMRRFGARRGQWGASRPEQRTHPPTKTWSGMDAYYQVLGLPAGANLNEVRKAYHKLALKYHPDKNPGRSREPAEKVFREVQNAYDKVCEHLRDGGAPPGRS